MSIEDSKKADLGPLDIDMVFILWLQYVENNADSIFIVVSDDSLVSVGSI